MLRVYDAVLRDHLSQYEQMVFLSGPRQVGKTTTAQHCASGFNFLYLNWDDREDRAMILSSYQDIVAPLHLPRLDQKKAIIIFDEIHKYHDWKNFLKGFFDRYHSEINVIVTGSAKLDIYKKGSDSLMGRYFLYREHPISVAECLHQAPRKTEVIPPQEISEDLWNNLWEFGGFPSPFLKIQKSFYNRWQNLRHTQLFQEDMRDLNKVNELAQCEVLAELLHLQAGQLVNYSNLAKKVRVADTTIRKWINVLEQLYYCFLIKPWTKNISRSLLKEPKCYLWDWSVVKDYGSKVENFIAMHLLKAVHYWTDLGFGNYRLYYLRDKEKREVDFVVLKDDQPWMLVEVKASAKENLSKSLLYFQEKMQAEHVFQVAFDMDYVDRDCFAVRSPIIVPAKTFLSQLI